MKRALIVLLFALTAFAARGQSPLAEKGVERPNVIEIRGGSTWDINSSLGLFFYAEYARNMKGKF